MKDFLLKLVILFSICVCILCLIQVFKISNEYKQSEEEYESLVDDYISYIVEDTDNLTDYSNNIDEIEEIDIEVNEIKDIDEIVENNSINEIEEKNEIKETVKSNTPKEIMDIYESSKLDINVDFKSLKKKNPDIVGWIYCKGTPINYPVVQATNNSYYLKHTFYGNYNASGTIFMEAENKSDMSDKNTILYGHHMRNGSMFASIEKYRYWWYYRDHPIMYYLTEDNKYRIDIITYYETGGYSDIYTIGFSTDEKYDEYLKSIRKKSVLDTTWLPISVEDKIITLSTCSYSFNNARYIVQGKITCIE